MCGRLRCCLVYEYEQYLEAKKHLPRIGKQIGTPHGPGKVIGLNPLAEMATVIVEDTRYTLHREELIPLDQLQALKEKSAMGCTREGSGPCECGARMRGGSAEQKTTSMPEAPAATASSQPPQADSQSQATAESKSRRRRNRSGRSRRSRGNKPASDQSKKSE
jgi:hypothetical protein